MPKKVSLIGRRFARLTVIADAPAKHYPSGVQHRSQCLCDCGKTVEVQNCSLTTGLTRSCGCLHQEIRKTCLVTHGHKCEGKTSRTYQSWNSMLDRCNNPNVKCWRNYGGRGICVCERWKSFENFLADMGENSPGLSIERINNDGNYEPGNCKWATQKEQMRNTRKTLIFTFRGITASLPELCDRFGVHYGAVYQRIHTNKWSIEEAFTLPHCARGHRTL